MKLEDRALAHRCFDMMRDAYEKEAPSTAVDFDIMAEFWAVCAVVSNETIASLKSEAKDEKTQRAVNLLEKMHSVWSDPKYASLMRLWTEAGLLRSSDAALKHLSSTMERLSSTMA